MTTQHRLLLSEYYLGRMNKIEPVKNIKWHNIKSENGQHFVNVMREYIQDILVLEEDEPHDPLQLWNLLHEPCIERAESLLGVNRGYPLKKGRETWWWRSETKVAVGKKTRAFKAWKKCSNNDVDRKLELRDEYDDCIKEAKRAAAKARAAALQGLYDELENVSMKTAHREQAERRKRASHTRNGCRSIHLQNCSTA